MPANTAIIGRVAVKVLPDTSDFRRDAERKLDAVEKSLGPLTVPTKIDMSGASRGFLEELRKINARNRALDSRKIRFQTIISTDGMREAVSRAVRQLNERAAQRRVRIQTDLVATTAVIELDRQSLDEVRRALEDFRDNNSPLKIVVRPEMAFGATTFIERRLDYLSRPRTVPLLPYVSTGAAAAAAATLAALSGARVVNTYLTRVSDTLRNLDRSVPIISTLATVIAGLGSVGIASASNLFTLSASLASIAPAGLALPGILGGIAIGLGVTIAALKDFGTVFPDVAGAFSAMQDLISTNFYAVAEGPIRRMLDVLLPQLSDGFASTATALGGYFGGIADGIRDTLSSALGGMFTDLASSIEIATTGTGALIGIITTLGSVGAGYLPRLAQYFVDITTQFDGFLSSAAADGRLQGWIDRGIVALVDLGKVLRDIFGILSAVSDAAQIAGGSSLGSLANALERIRTAAESPGFQTGLVDTFRASHAAIQEIVSASGPGFSNFLTSITGRLGEILPNVGRTIGIAIGAIGDALAQTNVLDAVVLLFQQITNAVRVLAPAIQPVGTAFGAVVGIIASFVGVLGPIFAAILPALAFALTAVASAVQPLISVLGIAFKAALEALSPVIMSVALALADFISGGILPAIANLLAGLVPIVQALAPLIGQVLVAALDALTPILPILSDALRQVAEVIGAALVVALVAIVPLIPVLVAAFQQVLTAVLALLPVVLLLITDVFVPLLPLIARLIADLLPPLAEAFVGLVQALIPLIEAFVKVVAFLVPVLIPAIALLAAVLVDTLIFAINGVKDVFTGAWDFIAGTFNVFKSLFTGDWRGTWEGIKQIVSGVWDLIKGAFAIFLSVGLFGAAKAVLTSIKTFFKSIWDDVFVLLRGVWDGIRGAFSTFLSSLASAPSAALNSIKTLFKSVWDDISAAVSLAWTAIKTAVTTGVQNVVTVVRELPGKAVSALGDLGSTLAAAGRKLIEGFITGIKNQFGAVKDTLGGLTDKLTSWKGPESLDRVLLVNAGQLVIKGFINGLESQYKAVRDSLGGLTDDIGGMTVDGPSVTVGSVARRLNGIANGSLASNGEGSSKQFNYYAAPGAASLSAEEELFAATDRGRMVGW